MMCELHRGDPKPHLCHDCRRAAAHGGKDREPTLRITEADRGRIRIVHEPGAKKVRIEGALPMPENPDPWARTWD